MQVDKHCIVLCESYSKWETIKGCMQKGSIGFFIQ